MILRNVHFYEMWDFVYTGKVFYNYDINVKLYEYLSIDLLEIDYTVFLRKSSYNCIVVDYIY